MLPIEQPSRISGTPTAAELIEGEVVVMSPTGAAPGFAGDGLCIPAGVPRGASAPGGRLETTRASAWTYPNRKSFSPDAAYYTGAWTGMGFFEGAPIFAVEVRSEGDYGPAAERALAKKRSDYFAAGTQVVWTSTSSATTWSACYRAGNPAHPTVYRRGTLAEAEPAVPGWSLPVDNLFG